VGHDETNSPPLRLLGVTKGWPKRAQPVLDCVDLELREGTMTWVSGDNGAGKTTLLRIACGLLAPDRGRVAVRRFDLETEPQECKRLLGFLPAGSSGLYARLTVRQQLEYWSRLAFVPSRARERVVLDAIEQFGLTALAESRLDRISMGERQRVRLAMAFMHAPELVLLDEPRNSLDSAGLALLVDAIERLRSRGGAALWCSPPVDPPPLTADVELLVRSGRLEPA
jgi:ABC-type multidrug transport system ATPase subunit